MATGKNPGIRVPAPGEAHPNVIAVIQQIIRHYGWQASPTFKGIGISGFSTAGFVKNTAAGVLSGGNTLAVSDIPTHDLITKHSASDLTIGHVIRASGATTFAWAQLQHSDLGALHQDVTTAATPTFGGVVIANGGTVGQSAGPLLTFNDTLNKLTISGCDVGIGVAAASTNDKLHVNGPVWINCGSNTWGALLSLKADDLPGGIQWNIFATTTAAGEGAGKFVLKGTANRLILDDSGVLTLPAMSTAGFVKNTVTGVLSGGNSLAAADLPWSTTVTGLTYTSSTGVLSLTSGYVVPTTTEEIAWNAASSASHARQHSITSTDDHTSSATSGQMLKANANGLPIDATNTDTAVAAAVTASHAAVTVAAAPLTLSTQQLTFNYDTNDFGLSGNNLYIKDSGIDHGGLGGLGDDDHTQYLLASGTRSCTGTFTLESWASPLSWKTIQAGTQEWQAGMFADASTWMLKDVTDGNAPAINIAAGTQLVSFPGGIGYTTVSQYVTGLTVTLIADTTGGVLDWDIGQRNIFKIIGNHNMTGSSVAMYNTGWHDGSGTIAVLRGLVGDLYVTGGGALTKAYTIHASAPYISSGTIGSAYGLYIDGMKPAGVTTGYGIFQDSTDDINQFRGKCKFGTTGTPAEDVHASDTVRADTAFNLNGTDGVSATYAYPSSITVKGGIITAVTAGSAANITLRENHAADFTETSFTQDGNWHDLDLSGILPAGTKMFWARVVLKVASGAASRNFYLRKNGNTGTSDVHAITTQIDNVQIQADVGPVGVDSSYIVEYQATNESGFTWSDMQLIVQAYA
jgi:hypothetical protein